jgi:hypothetical protein
LLLGEVIHFELGPVVPVLICSALASDAVYVVELDNLLCLACHVFLPVLPVSILLPAIYLMA